MNSYRLLMVIILLGGALFLLPAKDNAKHRRDTFRIEFNWSRINMCNSRISPEIKLVNVPKGTAKLKWILNDLQVPEFHHGSNMIAYDGNTIQAGQLKGYTGPCPPSRSTADCPVLNNKKLLFLLRFCVSFAIYKICNEKKMEKSHETIGFGIYFNIF